MAADKKPVSFTTDQQTRDAVDRYETRHGHENRSKALETLVKVGLRESRNPVMYRVKDLAIEGAWYLALVAIVVVVVGVMTDALGPADAIQIAAVLVSVGAALIASVELIRAIGGHGDLAGLNPFTETHE